MRSGRGRTAALLVAVALVAACSDDGGADPEPAAPAPVGDGEEWVADLTRAVEAVEDELGGGQDFFEVTATPQLTNVFVAVDGATAAVPYVFVDGMLEEPAPRLDGASGFTFTAADIDIDETIVLRGIEAELPDSTVLAVSVEGGQGGFVRYVVSVRSAQGGALDVEVTGAGQVLSANPV